VLRTPGQESTRKEVPRAFGLVLDRFMVASGKDGAKTRAEGLSPTRDLGSACVPRPAKISLTTQVSRSRGLSWTWHTLADIDSGSTVDRHLCEDTIKWPYNMLGTSGGPTCRLIDMSLISRDEQPIGAVAHAEL